MRTWVLILLSVAVIAAVANAKCSGDCKDSCKKDQKLKDEKCEGQDKDKVCCKKDSNSGVEKSTEKRKCNQRPQCLKKGGYCLKIAQKGECEGNFDEKSKLCKNQCGCCITESKETCRAISDVWSEFEIVPDVIDAPPPQATEVQFDGVPSVNFGNIFAPTNIKTAPTVTWPCNRKFRYTLVMTDPDAPSRKEPTAREFVHWIVGNIKKCDLQNGDTIAPFIPSGPPQDSGLHRYTFLTYKQSKKRVSFKEPVREDNSFANRPFFNTTDFAAKYGLELVAGNFYQAAYDSSVDETFANFNTGR